MTTNNSALRFASAVDPQFGYYFLVLTSQRLLENIARVQSQLKTTQDEMKTLQTATTNRIA